MKEEDKKPKEVKEKRPKRKGCISGAMNPKPFTKDYNGSNFAKWTEPVIHKVLDELEEWLFEEVDVYDTAGKVIGKRDAGNCFYNEFLFKKKLYKNWMVYVSLKFDSVKKRLDDLDAVQEHKLQFLAATGKQKETITKFILSNKYKWSEKVESKVENTNIIWNEEKTYDDKDNDKIN